MSPLKAPAAVALCVVAWLGGAPARSNAQIRQPGSTPVTSSPAPSPRTVRIDAIVTDRAGAPLLNLAARDFGVSENGVAQTIESVELRRRAGATTGGGEIASASDEARAAREPGTRVIAIYLDEYHVSPGAASDRVRDAATRFLDHQVRAGDLLLVLKPLDLITTLRFTRDREAARRTIAAFTGRKGDFAPRTPFEEQFLGRAPAAVANARGQIVLAGLRALTTRIGELESGLSAIVLLSEGFTTSVPRARQHRLPDVQGLARAATRYQVALYALDPAADGVAAVADGGDADQPMRALRLLAEQTGGETAAAADRLIPALQRVSRDLDTHYVITYRSSHPTDGRFYDVQVTSTRRDARVRARSGYWAPLNPERFALRSAPPAPLRPLRSSPFIRSWVGLTVDTSGRPRAVFTWMPVDVMSRAGVLSRPEAVQLRAATPTGTVLFEGEVAPASRPSGPGQPARAVFEVPPGRVQLDFTILQSNGERLDVSAQDVEVPDPSTALPIILSPQLLRAATARDVRALAADPDAAPVPGGQVRRTDRLILRVPTLGAGEMAVTVKLLNRTGQLLREVSPMARQKGEIAQFDIALAALAPGEYGLEVTAANHVGQARSLIRLQITG